jgi:hypothetical protein
MGDEKAAQYEDRCAATIQAEINKLERESL